MGGQEGRTTEETDRARRSERCTLAELSPGQTGHLVDVRGPRLFRRRLMELGLVPGTEVRFVSVAPLGDPIEIEVRGARLSIRRAEADALQVRPAASSKRVLKVLA